MRKQFEFVKVAGTWFYWLPEFTGDCMELSMMDGTNVLLDSIDNKFVRLGLVDPGVAKITLKYLSSDDLGATYSCTGKYYIGTIWLCKVTLEILGEYPSAIYLNVF